MTRYHCPIDGCNSSYSTNNRSGHWLISVRWLFTFKDWCKKVRFFNENTSFLGTKYRVVVSMYFGRQRTRQVKALEGHQVSPKSPSRVPIPRMQELLEWMTENNIIRPVRWRVIDLPFRQKMIFHLCGPPKLVVKFYLENVANIPQCPSGGRNLAPHSGMLTILPAYILLLPLHLNELYFSMNFLGFTGKIRFRRDHFFKPSLVRSSKCFSERTWLRLNRTSRPDRSVGWRCEDQRKFSAHLHSTPSAAVNPTQVCVIALFNSISYFFSFSQKHKCLM